MYTRIVTIPLDDLHPDVRSALCAACHAACDRLAGVKAHRWTLNPATDTLAGLMHWTEHEAVALGTEALRLEVARLDGARRVLRCRDIPCLGGPRAPSAPYECDRRPNTGFVQHPPDYDPRG